MKTALSTSLSLPLLHCWSLRAWTLHCLWRHPQATLSIARRCFLACHLSCNQLISSSQKGFIKPENIYLSYTGSHRKKYVWTHTEIHLYGVLKVRTQGCTCSVAFCLSTFAILVMSAGDIICPTCFLIPIPRHPPAPVSLRAGWHPVSYSSGSAAPDGALSGTNEWKTPASPQVPLLLSQLFVAAYVQQTKPSKHDRNKAGNGKQL